MKQKGYFMEAAGQSPIASNGLEDDGILFKMLTEPDSSYRVCLLRGGDVSIMTPNHHLVARQSLEEVVEQGGVTPRYFAVPRIPLRPHMVEVLRDIAAMTAYTE